MPVADAWRVRCSPARSARARRAPTCSGRSRCVVGRARGSRPNTPTTRRSPATGATSPSTARSPASPACGGANWTPGRSRTGRRRRRGAALDQRRRALSSASRPTKARAWPRSPTGARLTANDGEPANVYVRDMDVGAASRARSDRLGSAARRTAPLRLADPRTRSVEEYGAVGGRALGDQRRRQQGGVRDHRGLEPHELSQAEAKNEHGETPKPRTPSCRSRCATCRQASPSSSACGAIRHRPARAEPRNRRARTVPTHGETGSTAPSTPKGSCPSSARKCRPTRAPSGSARRSAPTARPSRGWASSRRAGAPRCRGEPAEYNWTEPLWRRIARRRTGARREKSRAAPIRKARVPGERRAAPAAAPRAGDPCQGPFETRLTDTIDPGKPASGRATPKTTSCRS